MKVAIHGPNEDLMKIALLSQRKSSEGNTLNRRKNVKDMNHFRSTKESSSSDMNWAILISEENFAIAP